MSKLPKWFENQLASAKVTITRYGRDRHGRPGRLQSRWFFCGWYYHRENRGYVIDGPYGPFPCRSAAMVDASERYGSRSHNTTPTTNVLPMKLRRTG